MPEALERLREPGAHRPAKPAEAGMKLISLLSSVDEDLCIGCGTCAKVCPTLAITMVNKKPVVDPTRCRACANCNQRCPTQAVTMVKLDQPYRISVSVDDLPREAIDSLCRKAGFNPSQILCYCTATRAEEVAAAILKGAETPEDISLQTGLRCGCSVECIQPALRLLEAHGITPTPPEGGWQWYGRTPTLQDIPPAIRAKYNPRGFYFEDDLRLFEAIVQSERR